MYKTALFREINLLVKFNQNYQKKVQILPKILLKIFYDLRLGFQNLLKLNTSIAAFFKKISLKIAKKTFFHFLEFCQFRYILGPYCNQHVHDRTKLHISRVRVDTIL